MAQRMLTCPNCSSSIEVPDGYLKSMIPCPACATPVRRLGGAPASAAPWEDRPAPRPIPQQPPQARPQPSPQFMPRQCSQGPVGPQQRAPVAPAQRHPAPQAGGLPYPGQQPPAQYAQYGAQYPAPYGGYPTSSTRQGNPAVKVILIVVAVIFGVGVLAGIASVFLGGGISTEDVDSWQFYQSASGRYRVRLPGSPAEQRQPMPTGAGPSTLIGVEIMHKGRNFGAAYFDIPVGRDEYSTFDYAFAGPEMAKEYNGKVVEQGPRSVAGEMGYFVKIQQQNPRYHTKIIMLHHGNRVYMAFAEAYTSSEETAVDSFLNSFALEK